MKSIGLVVMHAHFYTRNLLDTFNMRCAQRYHQRYPRFWAFFAWNLGFFIALVSWEYFLYSMIHENSQQTMCYIVGGCHYVGNGYSAQVVFADKEGKEFSTEVSIPREDCLKEAMTCYYDKYSLTPQLTLAWSPANVMKKTMDVAAISAIIGFFVLLLSLAACGGYIEDVDKKRRAIVAASLLPLSQRGQPSAPSVVIPPGPIYDANGRKLG